MSSIADHIVIAGWNETVPMLLQEMLEEYGETLPTVIVFANVERPQSLPTDFQYVRGDFTKEIELDKVRMRWARTVVVVADGGNDHQPGIRDATTVLTVFTIRSFERKLSIERKAPIHIVAEILDPENDGHATVAGADEVLETARLASSLLAHTAGNPGIGAVIRNIITQDGANVYNDPIPVALLEGEQITFGKIRAEARESFGVLVMGVIHREEMHLNPSDDEIVYAADRLVYMSEERTLAIS